VYLLARFTSAFDAYAGERAKLLAQFHNLDKLVEQTKALTATTENIKARISDDVWDRQQRWLKRLDCYIDVLQKLAAYVNATYELRAKHGLFKTFNGPHDEVYLQMVMQRSEAITKYNIAVSALALAQTAAELVCAKKPLTALRQFVKPEFDLTNLEPVLEHSGKLATSISAGFVDAARLDLGYERLVDGSAPR
jgi:hypothetical protein